MFDALQSGTLLKQYVYVAIIFIQLFQYCYGGQFIMDRSEEVGEEFYSDDKDFLIVIAKAQQPFVFRAQFYEANIEFVAFVVNSSYSLLTVLQNFV